MGAIAQELKQWAEQEKIFLGTAALPGELISQVKEWSGVDFKDLPRAVSLAVPFPAEVINQLQDGPSRTYLYYYNAMNSRIDALTLHISARLEVLGWKTFPIPASQRIRDRFQSIFSHRGAAVQAGLGWIGLSCNLITPERGPRVRLGTVLTDCPLPAGKPLASGCGNCRACVEICPPGAIKGVEFAPDVPIEERFDPQACHDYKSKVCDHFGKRVCGLCLAVCPHGNRQRVTRGRDNDQKLISPGRRDGEAGFSDSGKRN